MMRFAAGLAALLLSACATHAALPDLAQSPPAAAPAFVEVIAAFGEADRMSMPPACATLFVGSSSIRFWRSLKEDFPDRNVINRGFGGSTVWEVAHYFDQVVTPYRPKEIVFYAGENDINAGRTADEAYADFVHFMRLKEKALGATPVWYISAKPSKLRRDQFGKQSALNGMIEALAGQRNDLAYVDVVSVMLKTDGTPKDIYVEDDLHMTPDGYALWTPIVDAALDAGQAGRAPGC